MITSTRGTCVEGHSHLWGIACPVVLEYALNALAVNPLQTAFFQEAVVKIMKMRKRMTNAQLQTELVEMLKQMFLPSRKMIKEQIEWLIEQKYLARDENDINMFVYLA